MTQVARFFSSMKRFVPGSLNVILNGNDILLYVNISFECCSSIGDHAIRSLGNKLVAYKTIFKTQPLTIKELLITVAVSSIIFWAVEIEKIVESTIANRKKDY